MVLPWTSVMVILVLLKVALTCAMPEVMFFFSRRRMRACGLAMDVLTQSSLPAPVRRHLLTCTYLVVFFLPATGRDLPLRVRALVLVR